MTRESQAIEVEVVEVDGLAPPVRYETREERPPRRDWRNWQGKVLKLDARWWPLWVFLGVIAFALMMTLGLVIGLVFLVFRILGGISRALFR